MNPRMHAKPMLGYLLELMPAACVSLPWLHVLYCTVMQL